MTAHPTTHRLGLDATALADKARRLRRHVVRMVAPIGEGYAGQGLGAADILAALYFHEMAFDPEDPGWEGRDRFVLSPAHYGVGLFAALAERGVMPVQELAQYGVDGSPMEIIASERLAGVEATCGSLGMGLSVGVGMALSLRRRGSASRVYVLIGDGELQEGSTWEAAMSAAAFGLRGLCAIVDVNDMQVDGATTSVLNMGDIAAKWRAFGWNAIPVDGHDIPALLAAFAAARDHAAGPTVLIAETRPGRGVSALEGRKSHFAKLPPEVAAQALTELEG
ncbi:transketolase [Roseomonas sp. OT10]|uniref:transketolase n=1 Tax=Roseomonas cutis TaxID=2897332 RepID=UPI001E5D7E9D|nr:transketolase [Roseomonas sp. OT10]UFN48400.1 transketolase [Roseomonas sp. OT10]